MSKGPDLEEEKNNLVVQNAKNNKILKDIEVCIVLMQLIALEVGQNNVKTPEEKHNDHKMKSLSIKLLRMFFGRLPLVDSSQL